MKIIALSDSHCSGRPSSWSTLFDKRTVGLFNYHYLRKHQHNQRYMDIALDYILSNPPDIVVCTGDITTSGEPSEFEVSCNQLKPLVEDKRFEFFYVPGNHDNYVNCPLCNNALKNAVKYLNRNKFELNSMPYLYETDELDFCFVNESYPVHMVLSHGILKKDSKDCILKWLDNASGNAKVLFGHYPLFETENRLVRWRHKLYGHKEIVKQQKKGRLDLSVSGHVHHPTCVIDERGRGNIIVGSVTRNACLAEITYNKINDIFKYRKIEL